MTSTLTQGMSRREVAQTVAIRTRVFLRKSGQDPDTRGDLDGLIMDMATELGIGGDEYSVRSAKRFVRSGF